MSNKGSKEHSYCVNRHQATCTRTDRDLYRICPSKLSRRELENLYFTLLENNVDLKKNLNMQQEKIKTLSVKVQRLSYPRNVSGSGKDSVTSAIVSEQKDCIIQLRRANERMAERIRVLNMKLSSAKQFAGKNKTINFHNATLSSSNIKSNCTSCANLVHAGPSQVKTNSTGTQTDYFAEKYSNSSCDIKCKPTMDELNKKINNLQEELQRSRQRIEKLEALVTRLQVENQTVRAQRAASEHAMQQQDVQLNELKEKLRCAEAKVNDMNMELTIQKKKHAELETELKLGENIGNIMRSSVAKTIEEIDQKKVVGQANAPTDKAILIRDELNKASDEVYKAQGNVQFIKGETVNEVNRFPDGQEYNWGDVMARTVIYTEPVDKISITGEKNTGKNGANIVPEDIKMHEENLSIKEINMITSDIKLTTNEENVVRKEDIKARDDLQFKKSELTDESKNEVITDDVEYDWGDFMAGTQGDKVAECKKLTKNDMNTLRNEINEALDVTSIDENNVKKKEINKVPSGYISSRGEEMPKKKNSLTSEDIQFIRSEGINMTKNDVNDVPNDVEYNWGDFMARTNVNPVRLNEVNKIPDEIEITRDEANMAKNEDTKVQDGMKLMPCRECYEKNVVRNEEIRPQEDVKYNWDEMTNNEVKVPRVDVKNVRDEVKSLREDANDHPEQREQQDLNKNTETEKDQLNIKLNQELINKISELVSQLESLKITAAGEAYTDKDKIKVKEKPTEYKQRDVRTKKPDTLSAVNKQKLNQKLYDVKTKEKDNTLSQAKKVKPMRLKPYEAKPKKANLPNPINKQNSSQCKPCSAKSKIRSPTSINEHKPTQQSYEDKTKNADIISSQINKEKPNQYESYEGLNEAIDNISIRIDKDNPVKYDPYDVKTEANDICIQKNEDKPLIYGPYYDRSTEEDDIEIQMKKKLAEYESIDVTAKEADNILTKISNLNAPKHESYDIETKESDDIFPNNDSIECIMEIQSDKERNKFKIQEPVSTDEVKGISRDTEKKRIQHTTIPIDEFDSSREHSIDKLSTLKTIAPESNSKTIPKSPRKDDDPRYQIPGPIPVDLNDQKRDMSGDPNLRKNIDDTPDKSIEPYRKRPYKISYIEKSKQAGSISESPLKNIIDEKSAKSKDSHGESLRKRSLEEKSEKIRKTFNESPNRMSFQDSSEDRNPFPDLKAWQSFDEKVMKISDSDHGVRPVRRSKDPLTTRPSISLSDKTARTSLDDSFKENLTAGTFDNKTRLSLSAKSATIIKDYARDMETKAKKVRPRFSIPCATVIESRSQSRIWQPTESILKSRDAATSSHSIRIPSENDTPSMTYPLNMDVGAPPTVGVQQNAGTEAATLAHVNQVEEPFGAGPSSSRRNSGTSMDNKAPRTFSVMDKQSRATSPDNTDHEIASITDWTSDKDGPRTPLNSLEAHMRKDFLSEERTTTGTDASDHYTTASEGEVTGGLSSLGEMDPGAASNQRPLQQNVTGKDSMEATLQSISEELARCRKLLLSQRNQEKDNSVEHALHRSPATRQLSSAYTPICVFTLHIGTLVLSDEAVVWSRDKNLVLSWKFYSQSAAMTRVQPGRVAIFDFVTEYDVVFNDDMLSYMKNSEMPIVLCELGKEQQPFAKGWLPLQEALLHANRRADMSLALVPCQSEETGNNENFGEEIGVLDIWCSLRLDKSLLPIINRAMHKPSVIVPDWHMDPAAARESRIIQQAAEDEQSSQSRQSRDFALGRLAQPRRPLSMTVEVPRRTYSECTAETVSRNFYVPGQDIPCHASERYSEETHEPRQQPRYNFHSFSSPAQKAQLDYGNRGRGGYDRWPTPEQQASGIIINEVPANIRTDNDMREALEQKVRQDNTARWPKMEDYDCSLKHSSFGSVRSLAARHQLAKLKCPQKHKPDYVATDSFQDILNKDKQYIPHNIEGGDPNFPGSISNASRYIGVPGINKLAEVSRKSVKYSNAVELGSKLGSSASFPAPQIIEITILWLALNEECEAMANPNIKRLYVAYSFLGRMGADLETPFSLPKPKHYADKCYFNFKKTFHLHEADLPLLGHMATCRSGGGATTDPRDCVVFTLVSEPPEDPLGLSSCEDVGYAYLYLGDVLAYSGGSNGYTEVIGVRGVRGGVCGVLAVRVDNLAVLRFCLSLKP